MGKNILPFHTIKEINDESHCLIADEGELKMFLKFHHDLGTVIYFDDVPDFIIINPNWFVKALRCIVSAIDFISENLQLNWKDYEETGCIGIKMIQTIFQQKDPELAHNQEHIMHLLEKYDIDKISKLTDESMNLIRIQKISTELMCDILYELLLHDNYIGLKPRDESDITDLYSKIKGQNLRVPSKGLGGQRLPNESIQTNWRRCRENTVDQK
ncbi:unnamed protein product [Mytilus edulis]|uniref:COR domain-containing protein n=1 Tax=Mytilus edulis TaxID=6550 RepID=A0A8S3RAT4_MYTED|nr:unnamed protein product [Mytilus edulis]